MHVHDKRSSRLVLLGSQFHRSWRWTVCFFGDGWTIIGTCGRQLFSVVFVFVVKFWDIKSNQSLYSANI